MGKKGTAWKWGHQSNRDWKLGPLFLLLPVWSKLLRRVSKSRLEWLEGWGEVTLWRGVVLPWGGLGVGGWELLPPTLGGLCCGGNEAGGVFLLECKGEAPPMPGLERGLPGAGERGCNMLVVAGDRGCAIPAGEGVPPILAGLIALPWLRLAGLLTPPIICWGAPEEGMPTWKQRIRLVSSH